MSEIRYMIECARAYLNGDGEFLTFYHAINQARNACHMFPVHCKLTAFTDEWFERAELFRDEWRETWDGTEEERFRAWIAKQLSNDL